MHQSGFVNIIGKPNAGKSTLLNELLGERLSIISPKVQTTRHRIKGIKSDEHYQIVFSDTPGTISQPSNKLHESMMGFVKESLSDADIFLYLIDISEEWETDDFVASISESKIPLIVVLNKVDLVDSDTVIAVTERIKEELKPSHIVPLSALRKFNTQELLNLIISLLPEGAAYYDKDQLTDKSERFIASEIIREKMLTTYKEEVPYSIEIGIVSFKDEPTILKIEAEIYVMRESQKSIIIGKGGQKLKSVGMAARKEMELFFGKQIFLKTFVKVKENWRDDDRMLKHFGYKPE
jgi:GTP-binding protein Era